MDENSDIKKGDDWINKEDRDINDTSRKQLPIALSKI